jgi:DNA-binding MarR family transcriptional regulator
VDEQRSQQGDDSLTDAFWAVAGRLRRLTHEAVAPLGITPAHARALNVLRRHGDLRLSDLAEHLHIAARSATEVADALQERGLVQRSPDPEDRRATLILLTPDGHRTAEHARTARAAAAETYFARLPPEDRATLTRLLRALSET